MTSTGTKLKDPRVCRVFFSSPFSGMEEERELLTKRYWPQIQSFCNSKGVQFRPVDMRWGITSEASNDAQVVSICLRELDRSDMFVGFFGQRYGWHGKNDNALQENLDNAVGRYPWIEKHRNKSVTELEFLQGHLNEPGKLPACFAFRDKKYDDKCREQGVKEGNKKKVFKYSAESDSAMELLNDLKERVNATSDKTIGVMMVFETPAEGAEFIFNCVWRHLNEVLLKDICGQSQSARETTKASHDAFIASKKGIYVGGDRYFEKLDKYVTEGNKSGPSNPLLILGESGCGKSAMLCNWISDRKEATSDTLLYHFVGCDQDSTRVKLLLLRITRELNFALEKFKEDTEKPVPNDEELNDFENDKETNEKQIKEKCNSSQSMQQLSEVQAMSPVKYIQEIEDTDRSENLLKDKDIAKQREHGKQEITTEHLKPISNEDDVNRKEESKNSPEIETKTIETEKTGEEITEKELLSKPSRELASDMVTLMNQFGDTQQRAVFVIDGLDKIESLSNVQKPLFWLPKLLPSNVFIILGTTPLDDKTVEECKNNRECHVLEIEGLSSDTKKELCLALLKENSKDLSPNQLNMIIQSPQTDNPLFLTILMEELCTFGQFRKLTEKIDEMLASKSLTDIIRQFLDRLENDYNTTDHPDIVQRILCALAVCQWGLTEAQIMAAFDIKTNIWSPLFFSLEKYLINRSGYLGFANETLKTIVIERYITKPADRKSHMKKLVTYFEKEYQSLVGGNDTIARYAIEEMLFLLHELGETVRLGQMLTRLPIFQNMCDYSKYNLLKYWHSTGLSPTQIANRYIKEVDKLVADEYLKFEEGVSEKLPIAKIKDVLDYLSFFMDMAKFIEGNICVQKRHLKLRENSSSGSLTDEHEINEIKYELACAFTDQGLCSLGEKYHLEVLEFRKKHLEDGILEEEEIGFSYHGLGLLYSGQKEYDKAEPLAEKALEIHKRNPSKRSKIYMAANLGTLGGIACRRRNPQKALEMFQDALKLEEEYFCSEFHPRLAGALHNIGWAHKLAGNFAEAEEAYLKALNMSMNALGPKHPDIGLRYMNLGSLQMKRKNYGKAEGYYRKSLDVHKYAFGPNHIRVVQGKENLTSVYTSLSKFEEIDSTYNETLDFRLRDKSMDHSLPGCHRRFARHYISTQQYEKAARILMIIIDSRFAKAKTYVDLKDCDLRMAPETRPNRDYRYTLDGAVERFPDKPEFIAAKIRFEIVPDGDIEEIKRLCQQYVNKLESKDPTEDNRFPGVEVYIDVLDKGLGPTSSLDDNVKIVPNIFFQDKLLHLQLSIAEEALKSYPGHIELMEKLASLLEESSRPEEALTLLKKTCEQLPESTDKITNVFQKAVNQKDFEYAEQLVCKAEEKWPEKKQWIVELRMNLDNEKGNIAK